MFIFQWFRKNLYQIIIYILIDYSSQSHHIIIVKFLTLYKERQSIYQIDSNLLHVISK
jgi:hypothetical protein